MSLARFGSLSGRTLDVAVASAMKLDVRELDECNGTDNWWIVEAGQEPRTLPFYSSDPGDAWAVRLHAQAAGWESHDKLTWMGGGSKDRRPMGYSVWFRRWVSNQEQVWHDHVANCNNAPLAICRAFLSAILTPAPEAGA